MNKQTAPFLFFCFLLAMTVSTARAQFYLTGESPARVKWDQIRGNNYTVIYPQEIDSLAQRYLWLLEGNRPSVMAGLLINPKPIPVILHPYTTVSNGFVVWAPKRVELYTRPPANRGYSQNWEKQLVLHESRHVGQVSHFTKGVYKPLSWLLGQQITGLGLGIYPSKWLMEGDAVVAETELSNSGRGRSASFMEYYRASFLSGEYRNWDKWRYGSYKYYTPDMYAFGYLINTTARTKTKKYTYAGEIFDSYVRRFYNPNVINATYKKVVGATTRELLKEGMIQYTEMWQEDFKSRGAHTDPDAIKHKQSSYYTEYRSALPIHADTTLYIKYSYDNPTALVMLSSDSAFLKKHKKGEKTVRAFSSSTSNLRLSGRNVLWTENVDDVRWGKESFNRLFSYNLDTKKIKRLTKKTAYNNPAVSVTGDSVSVVEYPVTGGSNLVILHADSGRELFSVPAPDHGQITESAWIGNTIYALVITSKGLGLFSLNLDECRNAENRDTAAWSAGGNPGRNANDKVDDNLRDHVNGNTDFGSRENAGRWRCVLNEQNKTISALNAIAGSLYFESDIDGVNNVYSFDVVTEKLNRLTNARFAAHDPYIANGNVYYSNLETGGLFPVYKTDKPDSSGRKIWVEKCAVQNEYVFPVAEMLTQQANEYMATNHVPIDTLQNMPPEVKYEAKRYRKGSHLFRFHSWAPVYYNVDKIMQMSADHFYELVSLGATAYSQNSLGTAVTMLGYSYRKGHHAGHVSFEYSGWYPVFKIMADYNEEDCYKYKIDKTGGGATLIQQITGNPLLKLSIQAYVPIHLSSRGWQRGLVPQVLWKYENNAFYSYNTDSYINRQQISYGLQYYQMRPVAAASIFPKWGFNVTVRGAVSPNGEENFGSLLAGYSYFYFPGLMRRQGIRLSASYQKQFVENKWMLLDNQVEMPRGYGDYYGENYYKFSLDYAIPVQFKEVSLGWFAYLKQLQIIPFVDIAAVKRGGGTTQLNSYGADILLDAIICHIGVPIRFGVRYARINDFGERNHIGFLFSTSLF